jgi:uncharacterized membrane protein YtjA (UPF0391 family)
MGAAANLPVTSDDRKTPELVAKKSSGTNFRKPGFLSERPILVFEKRRDNMLGWALTFLVVALIAGALGFGGIAGASAGIAQILFVVFLILFAIAMVARAVRGRPPV